jgi:phosphohistidine phosphatase SixA
MTKDCGGNLRFALGACDPLCRSMFRFSPVSLPLRASRFFGRAAAIVFAFMFAVLPHPARATEAEAWAALRQGAIALIRHAYAPGTGDPRAIRLGDCSTQRNLDATGRAQAAAIGAGFRARGIDVGLVLTSEWCRTRDTAEIAFPGRANAEPVFNSFFDDRALGPAQTRASRDVLERWSGPGALVIFTHQVNITALSGVFPASGEIIVVRMVNGAASVIGRIKP